MKKIYEGTITNDACDGEGTGLTGIMTDKETIVLAKQVCEDMDELGHFLSVSYYVSNKPITNDEHIKALFCPIVSDEHDDIEFGHAYSEITGYLWTDESLVVGGHDLLREINSHTGKFIHLEIEYTKEKP